MRVANSILPCSLIRGGIARARATFALVAMRIAIEPLPRDNWDDLVELFGRPGASIARGCYCMC